MTLRAAVSLALAGLACVGATPIQASSGEDISGRLAASLRSPHVSPARTSALAVDVRTGAVLYEQNATTPVVPASNEKLPVAWAALMRLGPGYRFTTDLLGTGGRVGDVWEGSLYLRGSGDPTLTSADLGRLAAAVRATGIRRVTGRILGDESAFDQRRGADGWKPSFLGVESPPLSALVVDRARGWPGHSPPVLAARALRDALARRGVQVDGAAWFAATPRGAVLLARDRSVRMATIARLMNRDSDNFTAELVLKHLGTLGGGLGTSGRGARVVLEELAAARIPTEGVRIVDGSGLSSLDRLTAESLVGVIRAGLANPRIRTAFVDSLAIAGRKGTLETRLVDLAAPLRGKTGTTSLSCSLSGVVADTVAFAVLQNGSPVAFWPARAAQDRFVKALARSLTRSTAAKG